tara:strand:- start:216 stop:1943 length:1728 start_codon:yes stop_codon:yes gene_type:complete
MLNIIIQKFRNNAAAFGLISVIGGFVTDVLQPIAPFSSYLFYASSVATLIIFFTFLFKSTLREKLSNSLTLALSVMIITGIITLLQKYSDDEKKGVLASNIPGISKLQNTIGIIQDDVSSIKKSTEKIEDTTDKIEEKTEKIEDTTDKIVLKLDEIQKEFSSISEQGGVIENPKRPEQYYHNARIYEQRGDYINARKSYNNYFTFKLDFIDPHLRYQKFLKVQEGRSGAREIYSIIYENDKRPIIEFARILLFDPPKRTEMLESFISKNPDFTPAFYELSKEFSEIRKGTQTLSDKKKEKDYLEKFVSLEDEGKFLKFFVDNEIASEWSEYAQKRLKALSLLSNLKQMVKINPLKSNQGWHLNLQVVEPAKEIFYKIGDEEEYISTGFSGYIDPRTNLEMPGTTIFMPNNQETINATIFLKYKNINDEIMGPFELNFDRLEQFRKNIKENLNRTVGQWVVFRADGKRWESWGFHGLVGNRCAISKIKYRFFNDKETSEWKEFKFTYLEPKCDILNEKINSSPSEIWNDAHFKYDDYPGTGSKFFTFTDIEAQLIFYDGDKSVVRKFKRPPSPLEE